MPPKKSIKKVSKARKRSSSKAVEFFDTPRRLDPTQWHIADKPLTARSEHCAMSFYGVRFDKTKIAVAVFLLPGCTKKEAMMVLRALLRVVWKKRKNGFPLSSAFFPEGRVK